MIKKIYSKWKKVAEKVVDFQIKIIFSALYFILVIPVSFFVKRISPISPKKKWVEVIDNFSSLKKLKLQ